MKENQLTISRKYALALIQASGSRDIQKRKEEIFLLRELIYPYINIFSNPIIDTETKFVLLDKLIPDKLKNSKVENFIRILIKNKRVNLINSILQEIEKINDELSNIQRIKICSRFELTETQKKEMEKLFSSMLSKKIILTQSSQEDLIGGLKIYFDDILIDNSISSNLEKIRRLFI